MKQYTPVFDSVLDAQRENEIRAYVINNLHRLQPFEDDWYGNDKFDVNAWTMDGVAYFVVYPVHDNLPDTQTVLARGRVVRGRIVEQ